MKRYRSDMFIIVTLLLILSLGSFNNIISTKDVFSTYDNDDYLRTIKQDIASLMMGYPDYIVDIEVIDINNVYLILKSGNKILYDDNKGKTQAEKLSNPDLQDMMSQRYKFGPVDGLMPEDYNPGRARVYPLLKEVYGASQHEVEKNLKTVNIGYGNYLFNSNNVASYYLKSAMEELNSLAKNNNNLWSFLSPIGGTYNYRYISQTNRLSPHAFGIAIDLASHKDDYWLWTTREAGEKRLLSYPQSIVDTMEKYYFIWGGKWGQFDTLHFEYRPELIIKAKYFTDDIKFSWYENLPMEDESVRKIVRLIEEKIKH